MKTQMAVVPGSLADVAERAAHSIAESFVNCDTVIIVDSSGSMETRDARGGRRRYDVALEELAALQKRLPGRLAIIAFSTTCHFVPTGIPPLLGGGTDLANALRFAKVADVAGMRFIVISDGEPDNEEEALAVATTYHGRIDTIYVGAESSPVGRDFLARLARAKGGATVTADRVDELADAAERLLMLEDR